MSDPLSAAVEAAVSRAIDARIPAIIEALKNAVSPPTAEPDKFVLMKEAAAMLGHSPSSMGRLIREGKLPPREKIGGKSGYRASTVSAILAGIGGMPKRGKR